MQNQQPTRGVGGIGHVQALSQMWLPVGVVGDSEPRQSCAIIIHDVARAVGWSHDLQGAQQKPIRGRHSPGKWAELESESLTQLMTL